MPTTYKVLAQTVTTAPTTATVTANLVGNSTFLANTLTTALATSGAAAIARIPGVPQTAGYKLWQNNNTGSGGLGAAWHGTVALSTDSTTASGSVDKTVITFQVGSSGSSNMRFFNGTSLGTESITSLTTDGYQFTPGVTVYASINAYYVGSQSTPTFYNYLYTSGGGSVQSNTSTTFTAPSLNTWVRHTWSFTPSTSFPVVAFAFDFNRSSTTNWGVYLDNFTLSTESAYSTTYPDIAGTDWTGATAGTTSPFNIAMKGTVSGVNSNTVLQYYGDMIDLYTVGAGKSAVVSTMTITNMQATATTFRVQVVPSGETAAKKHFIFYNTALAANATQNVTIGQTLAAGDKIRVSSDNAFVSFTLFGSEIS